MRRGVWPAAAIAVCWMVAGCAGLGPASGDAGGSRVLDSSGSAVVGTDVRVDRAANVPAPAAASVASADGRASSRPAALAVAGRLSVTMERDALDDQPAAFSSGSFVWRESGDNVDVAFSTPLGQIVAELFVEPGRARMRSSAGDEIAATPEELAQRRLGAPLPVSGMRDWLRGRDHAGSLRAPDGFREDGWSIAYPRMSDDGARPALIRLRRAGPPAIDVRVAIDDWAESAP